MLTLKFISVLIIKNRHPVLYWEHLIMEKMNKNDGFNDRFESQRMIEIMIMKRGRFNVIDVE